MAACTVRDAWVGRLEQATELLGTGWAPAWGTQVTVKALECPGERGGCTSLRLTRQKWRSSLRPGGGLGVRFHRGSAATCFKLGSFGWGGTAKHLGAIFPPPPNDILQAVPPSDRPELSTRAWRGAGRMRIETWCGARMGSSSTRTRRLRGSPDVMVWRSRAES